MKKTLKGYLLGVLSTVILVGGFTYAANTVRIVINNKELIPTDVNGNRVDPIIINGTTYLPVRAVANALGLPVYWDGPEYTVYLGDRYDELTYIEDVDNIGDFYYDADSDELTDNYGNSYSSAIYPGGQGERIFQTLLNGKYSRFECTFYVPKGCDIDTTEKIIIKADGKTIYSSPEITKTSAPIEIDVDISGCNNFEIRYADNDSVYGHVKGYIGDGVFYQ